MAGRVGSWQFSDVTKFVDIKFDDKRQPEPETPITIELNIPKPPGVMRTHSTGQPRHCLLLGAFEPSPLNHPLRIDSLSDSLTSGRRWIERTTLECESLNL